MKVSITLTVDVDPKEWDEAYGTGCKAADVREDVRRYVANAVAGMSGEGLINDVTLR